LIGWSAGILACMLSLSDLVPVAGNLRKTEQAGMPALPVFDEIGRTIGGEKWQTI